MHTSLDHVVIDPAILYFGTPVAIISSLNDDGSTNLAPISSIFWLGDTAVLGLGSRSHTSRNIERTRECVINLPSEAMVDQVNRLALTTGAYPVAAGKQEMGYRHVYDKFERSGLTPMTSSTVSPVRVAECPVSLEGQVTSIHPMNEGEQNVTAIRSSTRCGRRACSCTSRSAPPGTGTASIPTPGAPSS